jgi:gluconate kinase
MGPEMLQSQFAALEEPENVLELGLCMSVEDLIDTIVAKYFS